MYLEYYGFTEEPFNITPNSKFLFLSDRHREALASLLYGIEQRKGFIALTGEIGCGKTTICRAMLGRLDREKVRLALVLNPQLSDVELLQTINGEFGIFNDSTSKRELLAELNRFLLEEYQHDRNVVLLIDEAQRLSPDALEQVRLLSNLETETAKLLQIALVGQPELGDMLDLPELEQLNQRITVRFHISPLSFDEVGDYVAHRLSVAGAKIPVRFEKKALKKVYEYSGGVPRRINVVCDRALLVAYVREEQEIGEEIIVKAIEEVGGMPRRGRKARAVAKNEYDAPEPTDAPAPAPAAAVGGQRSAWPMAFALLLGLAAVAYAINTLREDARAGTPAHQESPPPASTGLFAKDLPPPDAIAPTTTPTATPSPTPEPTATPNPTATATPEPTATPTPEPSPEPQQPTTPTPTLEPTPTPTMIPEPTNTPEPTPELTPTAAPAERWSYDADGIMRIDDRRMTFPAAVLTWIAHFRGERLGENDLLNLRRMPADQVAQLQLTTGRAPYFIREARLPLNIAALGADQLPALLQTDDASPGFGPWSVIVSLTETSVTLHDPRAGAVTMPLAIVDDHLTAIVVPFQDADGIVGLQPLATGNAVFALQARLRDVGLYLLDPPTGVFDAFTEAAVRKYRENIMLPGPMEIDAPLALRLITESERTKQ